MKAICIPKRNKKSVDQIPSNLKWRPAYKLSGTSLHPPVVGDINTPTKAQCHQQKPPETVTVQVRNLVGSILSKHARNVDGGGRR